MSSGGNESTIAIVRAAGLRASQRSILSTGRLSAASGPALLHEGLYTTDDSSERDQPTNPAEDLADRYPKDLPEELAKRYGGEWRRTTGNRLVLIRRDELASFEQNNPLVRRQRPLGCAGGGAKRSNPSDRGQQPPR